MQWWRYSTLVIWLVIGSAYGGGVKFAHVCPNNCTWPSESCEAVSEGYRLQCDVETVDVDLTNICPAEGNGEVFETTINLFTNQNCTLIHYSVCVDGSKELHEDSQFTTFVEPFFPNPPMSAAIRLENSEP